MTAKRFTIAVGQMTAREDLDANLATCARLAAAAARQGADLLVLPENFAYLGQTERDRFAVAEALDAHQPGPIQSAVRDLAARHGLWLIAGGMAERRADETEPSKLYNACPIVSSTGEIVKIYRKIHLFDVDIPGGAQLCESETTYAGEEVVTVDLPWTRAGLSICYDLRFPEIYRRLADRGAESLVVPAAFTAHTGAAHWHVLLRARAIENQCYVAAAGQTGRHNPSRESYGHSLVVDPWGEIVAEIGSGEGIALATVDLAVVAKTRQQMPCLDHRALT